MTIEIQIVNPHVHDDEIRKMRKNVQLKLWTKPHMSHINAYRSHSIGGEGLILAIPKDENLELVRALESGLDTWIEVEHVGDEVRFRGFQVTQEVLDQEKAEDRVKFAEGISKPYRPRTSLPGWVQTLGDLPLQEGMVLTLIPESRDFYVQNLGFPVSFRCRMLQQSIRLTRTSEKIIRAVLTGYEVTGVVGAQHRSNTSQMESGVMKCRHVADAVFSFTLRST